jgi:hypothetical protein
MKPLFSALVAASALVALPAAAQTSFSATSAIPAPAIYIAGDAAPSLQSVQYIWGGRNYCWYLDGWHGPGWYWCGYRLRRGFGWGGPEGFRGWGRGGGGHYHGGGGHYHGGGHGGGFHGGHGGGGHGGGGHGGGGHGGGGHGGGGGDHHH